MLIVRLENKSGQELFVVKLECNNNVSVAVCRRDSFTTRQFKVEDLICDTSQIFSRNNAFIFFQKSDTLFLLKPGPGLNKTDLGGGSFQVEYGKG